MQDQGISSHHPYQQLILDIYRAIVRISIKYKNHIFYTNMMFLNLRTNSK